MTINRLKMELQSKREKVRRLEKNRKRLRQNGLLQKDARRFYRELGKQTIQITSPPSESEIEQYWGNILETEVCHNKSAFWLRRQIDGDMSQTAEHQWQPISDNEVTMCLKRMGSMACRYTAQLRRDLAKDDTSQSLHGSGTVESDGFFE